MPLIDARLSMPSAAAMILKLTTTTGALSVSHDDGSVRIAACPGPGV
jgi:hypothetical protein